MSPAIDLLRIIFGMAFLCYASYTDIKVRRVRNEVWMVMGLAGGILLSLQLFLEDKTWEYYLIFVPVCVLFASMFLEHEPLFDTEKRRVNFKVFGLYVIAIIAVIYQFYALSGETYFYQLLTIPILILLFYAFYQLGILHGGADAKGLMTISVLMPFYPHFFDFPLLEFANENVANAMELFFPFALLVLMNSVLFVVWVFLAFLVYNTVKRDFGVPEMLLGYKMEIDEVEKTFVWPMERIEKGERVLVLFPKSTDHESLDKLKELGVKRIWVTPKIPFIVALTAGFAISVFIGNIFGAIFGLLG